MKLLWRVSKEWAALEYHVFYKKLKYLLMFVLYKLPIRRKKKFPQNLNVLQQITQHIEGSLIKFQFATHSILLYGIDQFSINFAWNSIIVICSMKFFFNAYVLVDHLTEYKVPHFCSLLSTMFLYELYLRRI